MPKRIGTFFGVSQDNLKTLCKRKGLNDFEIELLIRIYWKRQSLNYISDTMSFKKYGKRKENYSVRTLNNLHKQAVLKLLR